MQSVLFLPSNSSIAVAIAARIYFTLCPTAPHKEVLDFVPEEGKCLSSARLRCELGFGFCFGLCFFDLFVCILNSLNHLQAQYYWKL